MPEIGVSMDEGTLVRWLKQPGDAVAAGEAIAEIETDKAAVELESPSEGVLGRHLVAEGATALVGQALVRILAPGEDEDDRAGAGGGRARCGPAAPVAATARPARQRRPCGRGAPRPSAASPHAARPPHRARARNPLRVGRRRRSRQRRARPDRLRRRRAPAAAAASNGSERPTRAPPAAIRDLIARKVSEAWTTIPHFAVTREVDCEELLALAAWCKREGMGVTVTDLLLVALARAVASPGDPDPAIGLAVATDDGVLIPVIRGVAGLGLGRLAGERARAVERARSGRLEAADLQRRPGLDALEPRRRSASTSSPGSSPAGSRRS